MATPMLELPPDDPWSELEKVRRQVEHLYALRASAINGQLSPRQTAKYHALLLRERDLLAAVAGQQTGRSLTS